MHKLDYELRDTWQQERHEKNTRRLKTSGWSTVDSGPPIGRATIEQLRMNTSYQIEARKYWVEATLYP